MEDRPADLQRVPLREEDARILALETGPIRGHTLKVLVLEDTGAPLPVEDLRRQVDARLAGEGPWRARLVSDPSAASGFAWEPDPAFEITRHVEAESPERALDDAQLRGAVAAAMSKQLPRDRPLWEMQVVPRLADGRSAIFWKVHHCLADGMTVMQAGSRLLWTEEQGSEAGRPRAGSAPARSAHQRGPTGLARVVGYRGLVVREFRRVWGRSPLAGEVGTARATAWTRCDLATLRDIGAAARPHATVNDLLLAAVAGALRTWLLARGRTPRAMKAQVPVSMHRAGGDRGGNQDSFLLVRLPVREADPLARLAAVSRATSRRKDRHDAGAIYALRGALAHSPPAVQHALQHVVQGPHEYSLSISDVPGPRGRITVLGRHVEAIYSFAEVAPDHGLRIAAVSLEGGLYLGLLADPVLVPDLDELAAGIVGEVRRLRERLLGE